MAIWIQSLSWAIIYALGQGLLVYTALRLILKLTPSFSANFRYHLSLSALTVLLAWFVATWWQQFQVLSLAQEQLTAAIAQGTTVLVLPMQPMSAAAGLAGLRAQLAGIEVVFPWLSGLYVLGLGLMLLRLMAGVQQLFSFRTVGIAQAETALNELLAGLKKRIHLDVPVKLLISAKAHVPMVIGFLKPVILLPAATMAQLSAEQLETILLHELAHIKRYDYLVNILQTIVETVLFFNPFIWMVSAISRREREHCCDDLVLAHTHEPLHYATALAALATQPVSSSTFTVAASGQPTHLFNRINRIMEMKKNPFSYSRMVAAIVIIATITGSIVWLTPSFAGPKNAPRPKGEKNTAAAKAAENKTANPANDKQPDKAAQQQPAQDATNANQTEETKLVYSLINDQLIDQVKGFVVEKQKNKLFINGRQQTDELASKYLSTLKKENMRIQVFSFTERMQQHPDGSFIQVLFPVQFSSGCVDYGAKKEGC